MMNRGLLLDMLNAALAAVDPYRAVTRALRVEGSRVAAGGSVYDLNIFDRVLVIGAGKATASMAAAVEDVLGGRIDRGVIVVKYGHAGNLRKIEQVEAAHPVPDEAGVQGTQRILELVRRTDEKTLVICLLSGGGSSLLVAPHRGITLEDKQRTTELLLKAGATIDEMNTVRKHLSAVKGGRLAQIAHPATVLTLILSDVIGDRLDVIASGPTTSDSTTFSDAAAVIERYRLKATLPGPVNAFVERGIAGQEPETARSVDACFLRTRNVIVGSNAQALAAVREKVAALGWRPEVVTTELSGDVRDAARLLARKAVAALDEMTQGEKRCLLSGGETTVVVRGTGKGGRNQELALAFALEIAGVEGITLLSAGTDGTDGPTDAAGAVVDGSTAAAARSIGIHPEVYLGNNDSYAFFRRIDSLLGEKHHILIGPTGTNVMDIQIILVQR
ncbi:MAG: glycerate kinase [Nitrospirae bacterium]|nr:glycerate kinase [Nitrospirota bacterium]NTW65701.1 glycerate kinase [Nitrospirota bacterium]